jgi:uncharacterized protein DUF5335
MKRVEIPPERWSARLDELTRLHEWWLVSIDIWTAGEGRRREVANLPLLGVSADRSGTGGTLFMSVACAGDGHITHVVHGVTRVSVEQSTGGDDSALLVDSADGTRTVLRFGTEVLPQAVDGLVRA